MMCVLCDAGFGWEADRERTARVAWPCARCAACALKLSNIPLSPDLVLCLWGCRCPPRRLLRGKNCFRCWCCAQSSTGVRGPFSFPLSVMLSQKECLWRVRPSRVHYSSTRVIRLAAARQCPFISPVPVRLSHAAGPAVRIPCLCMLSPCPLSSPSLDFSPIAFRPASCGARLAPHATFEPDLYYKL